MSQQEQQQQQAPEIPEALSIYPRIAPIYPRITEDALQKIPAELKSVPGRWICWAGNKEPINPKLNRSGYHGAAGIGKDPAKCYGWTDYDVAVAALGEWALLPRSKEATQIVGIGFVVGGDWACIDLDGGEKHGREPVPDAALYEAMSAGQYTERSVSGAGYHVFVHSSFKIPETECPQSYEESSTSYEIELFTRNKFIAITGDLVCAIPSGGHDHYDLLRSYYRDKIYLPWKSSQQRLIPPSSSQQPPAQQEPAAQQREGTFSQAEIYAWYAEHAAEILSFSDSTNYRSGQWAHLVWDMREMGFDYQIVLDWCRRGKNFRSDKEVENLWKKPRKSKGAPHIGAIIKEAKANGWTRKYPPGMFIPDYTATRPDGCRTYDWDDEITKD